MLSEQELDQILSHVKIGVARINIEGDSDFQTWREADEYLREQAKISSKIGYDKYNFEIEWTDGEKYNGRYDLRFNDQFFPVLLARHVVNFLRFIAGITKPEHMTQERYDIYLKQCGEQQIKAAQDFLERYDLGEPFTELPTPIVEEAPKEVKEDPFKDYPPAEDRDRNAVMKRIKKALEERSGKKWSVTGGKGTAWGWLKIDVPPSERIYKWATDEVAENRDGYMSASRSKELAALLNLQKDVHPQGESIMPNAWIEYIDRAEGRVPRSYGHADWD